MKFPETGFPSTGKANARWVGAKTPSVNSTHLRWPVNMNFSDLASDYATVRDPAATGAPFKVAPGSCSLGPSSAAEAVTL